MRVLFTTFVALLLVSAGAQALSWERAPLACLPDRAERWETLNEMQPCHCPPQDYCPESKSGLWPENVDIYVTLKKGTGNNSKYKLLHINGEDLDWLEPDKVVRQSIDGYTYYATDHLKDLLKDYVERESGWDIADVDEYKIERSMDKLEGAMLKVAQDKEKLPGVLISQCCDMALRCVGGHALINMAVKIKVSDNAKVPNPAYNSSEAESNEDYNVPSEVHREYSRFEYNAIDKEDMNELYCIYIPPPREGCLIEGTKIITADGSEVKIESLNIGDYIKSNKGEVRIKAINKFTQGEDVIYGVNGGEAFISEEHPILTTSGWKSVNPEITSVKSGMGPVGKLLTGDKIITTDGLLEVSTINKADLEDGATVYNLSIEGGEGFFANGMMVKDFNQIQIHY